MIMVPYWRFHCIVCLMCPTVFSILIPSLFLSLSLSLSLSGYGYGHRPHHPLQYHVWRRNGRIQFHWRSLWAEPHILLWWWTWRVYLHVLSLSLSPSPSSRPTPRQLSLLPLPLLHQDQHLILNSHSLPPSLCSPCSAAPSGPTPHSELSLPLTFLSLSFIKTHTSF